MKNKINRVIVYALIAMMLSSMLVLTSVSASNGNNVSRQSIEQLLRDRRASSFNEMEWRGNLLIRKKVTMNLTLKDAANVQTVGTARVDIATMRRQGEEVAIRINLNTVSIASDRLFEAWLHDDTTGYKLSLGSFAPTGDSMRSVFQFKQTMVNFGLYDRLVVTSESLNDINPNPSGTVVAQAAISSTISEVSYRAVLLGRNEVPATPSTAIGAGRFIINTKDNTLKYEIMMIGLSSSQTGAHIHGPANAGANANVLFALPLGNHVTGTWNYDQALESDLLAGKMYVNVHTANYPDGEIRGQIVQ